MNVSVDKSERNRQSFRAAELKSALWDAANTLRGSAVDRTDWKGYILPLLFFKRISDAQDVYFGRGQTILLKRERIKRNTFKQRRLLYRNQTA
uniref:type I restriction-modification system subunit M N-terminal domain-containing protein n=1 Tax=Pararhizobium sp. IMCC3301 TaxID=3067904 RepID=UPI003532520F